MFKSSYDQKAYSCDNQKEYSYDDHQREYSCDHKKEYILLRLSDIEDDVFYNCLNLLK